MPELITQYGRALSETLPWLENPIARCAVCAVVVALVFLGVGMWIGRALRRRALRVTAQHRQHS